MIPKVFRLVWLRPPVPMTYVRLLARTLELNPSWLADVYTLDRAAPILNNYWLDRTTGESFRSDIVRYEIMARYGGVYLDWDMIWCDPLDNWLDIHTADNFFVRDHAKSGSVVNAVYGLSRSNPIGWALVDRLEESCKMHHYGHQHDKSGVGYFTRVVRSFPERAVILPTMAFSGYAPGAVNILAGQRKFDSGTRLPCIAVHFWASHQTLTDVRQAVARSALPLPAVEDIPWDRIGGMTPTPPPSANDPSAPQLLCWADPAA
jgi:hypothetical protein